MKRHYIHIIFSWMLLAILFSQSALNFFHNHEDEKVSVEKSISGKADSVSCKGESCKVCDLNLFHEFFVSELSLFNFIPTVYSVHYSYAESFAGLYFRFGSSRAPPVFITLS